VALVSDRSIVGVLGALVLVGCAACASPSPAPAVAPTAATTTDTEIAPTPTVRTIEPSSAPPSIAPDDVARIGCAVDPPSLLAATVRPQADGLHVLVEVGVGRELSIEHSSGRESATIESDPGLVVLAIPPGDVLVRCQVPGPEDARPARLSVVDPFGVYRPPAVTARGECTAVVYDYVAGTQGRRSDPVLVARERLSGLRPSDVVEPAGYLLSSSRDVRVTRGLDTIGAVSFSEDGRGGWLLSTATLCGGLALR
jgi:hypothetical protein